MRRKSLLRAIVRVGEFRYCEHDFSKHAIELESKKK